MRRQLALLFLGLIMGAAIMNIAVGKHIDDLYWEKENLKVDLYETTERLKQFESQEETNGEQRVQEIKIELTTEESPFIELELKKKLHEITEEFLGEEVDSINHNLAYKLLDGRTVEVENKQYRLVVNMLIIADTITYYVEARSVEETDE